MPNRKCPSCRKRLPYQAKRCVACEWTPADAVEAPARFRWAPVWLAMACLMTIGGFRYADRFVPAVADWYASFAAQRLPPALSRFAPAATDPGAHFFCARRVVKELHEDGSVATFASAEETHTVPLGDGRFEVRSFVDEAREGGWQVRHGFVCTVRYQRGRWTLENLSMENYTAEEALRTNALQTN